MRFVRSNVIILLALCLVACAESPTEAIAGSGNVITRVEEIADFTGIVASHGFQVTVTPGSEYHVEVRVDDNIEPFLAVRQDGDYLQLSLDSVRTYNLVEATLAADVTMPAVQEVTLTGNSSLRLDGFGGGDAFLATLSGNSRLSGRLEARAVEITLSGNSETDIGGAADMLTLQVGGGSQANLGSFAAQDALVDVAGDSRTTVNASGRLDVEASGSSQVRYVGEPALGDVATRGGASVAAAE